MEAETPAGLCLVWFRQEVASGKAKVTRKSGGFNRHSGRRLCTLQLITKGDEGRED